MFKKIILLFAMMFMNASASSIHYSLQKGWNTITVPFSVDFDSAINSIGKNNIVKIWGQKDEKWVSYSPTAASFLNKLNVLIPGEVYSIKINTNTDLNLSFNYVEETRQVVNQKNSDKVVLYVPSLSTVPYNNSNFWTSDASPEKIKPIRITDNKTYGIDIPGVYAGKVIQFKIGSGSLQTVDLSDVKSGDTKVYSQVNTGLETPPGVPTTETNSSSSDIVTPPQVPQTY